MFVPHFILSDNINSIGVRINIIPSKLFIRSKVCHINLWLTPFYLKQDLNCNECILQVWNRPSNTKRYMNIFRPGVIKENNQREIQLVEILLLVGKFCPPLNPFVLFFVILLMLVVKTICLNLEWKFYHVFSTYSRLLIFFCFSYWTIYCSTVLIENTNSWTPIKYLTLMIFTQHNHYNISTW